MKTFSKLIILGFFASVLLAIVTCNKEDNKDPCDDTVKPEIEVGLNATVHVLTKDGDPIPNMNVELNIYKIPCGASAKGFFEFVGPTNEQGIKISSNCFYNLRNSDDEVWVDVFVPDLGNGSAEANSEYATFKYNDFIVGSVKEVHVYLHRNF